MAGVGDSGGAEKWRQLYLNNNTNFFKFKKYFKRFFITSAKFLLLLFSFVIEGDIFMGFRDQNVDIWHYLANHSNHEPQCADGAETPTSPTTLIMYCY